MEIEVNNALPNERQLHILRQKWSDGDGLQILSRKSPGYLCVYTSRNFKNQWIDTQWLAGKMFRDGHVTAMANCKVGWLKTPIMMTHVDGMIGWVRRYLPEEPGMSKEDERKRACNAYHRELREQLLQIGWDGSN